MENINNEEKEKEEDINDIQMEKLTDFQIEHNYIFRICLLGDSNVGKTSLINRYCDNIFKESYNNTIGVDFRVITVKYKDIITKVHIWDTAGQERFKSIAINYFRSAHGFIFVYDITDEDSFKNAEGWVNLAHSNSEAYVLSFLVGNKTDLEKERKVSTNEAEEFAKKKELFFLETSAKDNNNIEKMFQYFIYKLIYYFNNHRDKYIESDNTHKVGSNGKDINTSKEKKCNC